jgi:serine carboxypeptidase-like clade 2
VSCSWPHLCADVPTLASKILDEQPSWLPAMKGLGIGNPGIENDWYYNVNEYAFLTFAYHHALVPQPAYLAASDACGWAAYLTDCHNESYYDAPSPACQVATAAALAYLPKSWDPYDVTAPTCHSRARGGAGRALVAAYSPALEHLKVITILGKIF